MFSSLFYLYIFVVFVYPVKYKHITVFVVNEFTIANCL